MFATDVVTYDWQLNVCVLQTFAIVSMEDKYKDLESKSVNRFFLLKIDSQSIHKFPFLTPKIGIKYNRLNSGLR